MKTNFREKLERDSLQIPMNLFHIDRKMFFRKRFKKFSNQGEKRRHHFCKNFQPIIQNDLDKIQLF